LRPREPGDESGLPETGLPVPEGQGILAPRNSLPSRPKDTMEKSASPEKKTQLQYSTRLKTKENLSLENKDNTSNQ
jgi:hypothetical protein